MLCNYFKIYIRNEIFVAEEAPVKIYRRNKLQAAPLQKLTGSTGSTNLRMWLPISNTIPSLERVIGPTFQPVNV